MRIGVNALQMKSKASASKAGLSRYAYSLIDALVSLQPDHDFTIFVNQAFEVPANWRAAPRFRFEATKGKFGRMPHIWGTVVASAIARSAKFDAWLSLAHTLPLWTRLPRVLVVHDLFSMLNPELYVERRARITANSLRRSIAVADRIVAVSNDTKEQVHEHLCISLDRITVTHLGPGNTLTRREPAAVCDDELQRIGVPFKRFLFMLSTVEPRKNVPRLLQAIAKLNSDVKYKDIGLAIGGGKGWENSDIYTMSETLGIADKVKFLGYVADEDLPALFARCEAFVLPSLSEGFGITVLEAMLCGAPVVCSRAGALPEVGGDAALYFDPKSVDDMAAKIAERLTWTEPREAIVRRGFEQARKFSWENAAKQTINAVEEACRK